MSNDKGKVVRTRLKRRERSNKMTFLLSGVLARGDEQFKPVRSLFPGTVYAYHTEGKDFPSGALIHYVAKGMAFAAKANKDIVLVGASMGGMLVPFIVAEFRGMMPDYDMSRMRVILIDAPNGLDGIDNPLAHRILRFGALAAPAGGATSLIGMKVPYGDNEMPKRAEVTSGSYEDAVAQANQGLSGHYLSMLIRQTRWMIEAGRGPIEQAVKALGGVYVVYVVCDMGDSPVVQPTAVQWWVANLPQKPKVLKVDATHCGFTQNYDRYEEVFAAALAA